MLTGKAMSGAENYASRHLSNNDYYSKGETITGQWMGRGAQLLGLEGEVTMRQFDAVRQGHDPYTGEFLRQRQSADRFVTNELTGELEQRSSARNLYDFTVSAPKGVSVMSLYDPRLIQAHRTAVAETAAEMEGLAEAYVRKDGAQGTRKTSNLVIAAYDHDTSRELDPQIHTHLVAGNLTFDAVEGRWKALAAFHIYQHRAYLTEVYR
ncbi:MAG: relaxase domain-containing protein, partial [Acidobacteriota bacterium]|nr:relaxase domain-containing protein [Acidobacteriota bacterium]